MPGLILISSSLLSHPLRVRHHRDKYPFDDLIIAVIRQSAPVEVKKTGLLKGLNKLSCDHVGRPMGVLLHLYGLRIAAADGYEALISEFTSSVSPFEPNDVAKEKLLFTISKYFKKDSTYGLFGDDQLMMIMCITSNLVVDSILKLRDNTRGKNIINWIMYHVVTEKSSDAFRNQAESWMSKFERMIDPAREITLVPGAKNSAAKQASATTPSSCLASTATTAMPTYSSKSSPNQPMKSLLKPLVVSRIGYSPVLPGTSNPASVASQMQTPLKPATSTKATAVTLPAPPTKGKATIIPSTALPYTPPGTSGLHNLLRFTPPNQMRSTLPNQLRSTSPRSLLKNTQSASGQHVVLFSPFAVSGATSTVRAMQPSAASPGTYPNQGVINPNKLFVLKPPPQALQPATPCFPSATVVANQPHSPEAYRNVLPKAPSSAEHSGMSSENSGENIFETDSPRSDLPQIESSQSSPNYYKTIPVTPTLGDDIFEPDSPRSNLSEIESLQYSPNYYKAIPVTPTLGDNIFESDSSDDEDHSFSCPPAKRRPK